MNGYASIGETAEALGVSVNGASLGSEWQIGREHTAGGHRRYDLTKLLPEQFHSAQKSARETIALPAYRHMTKKMTWSDKSKCSNSIVLNKAGRLK